jgi:very-short-patch-repair endonuclease
MADSALSRYRYFDRTIHIKKIKDCISGQNEERVLIVLENLGYKIGKDFERQHPIGQRYVLDFAFVNEQVSIEVDGISHEQRKQQRKDAVRDTYLLENNWITIRIPDKKFFGASGSFYKSLIKEVVEERRKQYENGRLYPLDFTTFNDKDYE